MTRTISVTLPEEDFQRLSLVEKERGRRERSKIIQQALRFFLGTLGPDERVVKRWSAAYRKAAPREAQRAEAWVQAQTSALGEP